MRLGLVTDIHNHAAELARALELFAAHGVDRVVTIGDTFDAFSPADGAAEVAALLRGAGAVGVWGNHDFTLCRDPSEKSRAKFGADVLEFAAGIGPRLEVEGYLFTHKESSSDPHDVEQLWAFREGPLDLMERAALAFEASHAPRQFVGHYHRWWAATPAGPLPWDGARPLEFAPGERHFVVVAAVSEGWCGVLDTDAAVLRPLRCTVV